LGIIDHDSDSQGYRTLAKGLFAQSTNDDEMSQEEQSEQLSTTKMTKVI